MRYVDMNYVSYTPDSPFCSLYILLRLALCQAQICNVTGDFTMLSPSSLALPSYEPQSYAKHSYPSPDQPRVQYKPLERHIQVTEERGYIYSAEEL